MERRICCKKEINMESSPNRKLLIYIATSLDGYIAATGDDLSFLSVVQKEGEDYGYHDFIKTVDTVILGRRTYDWVTSQVDFPHADKETYVITRPSGLPSVKSIFTMGILKHWWRV
jgi:dihydrofolate reductase